MLGIKNNFFQEIVSSKKSTSKSKSQPKHRIFSIFHDRSVNGGKTHLSVSKKICSIPRNVRKPFFLLLLLVLKKEKKEALLAGIACSSVQGEPFLLSFETV